MPEPVHTNERLRVLGRRPLLAVKGINYTGTTSSPGPKPEGRSGPCRTVRRGSPACAEPRRSDCRPTRRRSAPPPQRFRYGRGLLSAEQLSSLALPLGAIVADWGEYLERTLLLDDETGRRTKPSAVRRVATAEAEYVDAICSGFLEREALAFASDMALADLTPVEAAGDQRVMVERTLPAASVARRNAVSEPGVDVEIARHALDWTRLDLAVLELDDAGAARRRRCASAWTGATSPRSRRRHRCREPHERLSGRPRALAPAVASRRAARRAGRAGRGGRPVRPARRERPQACGLDRPGAAPPCRVGAHRSRRPARHREPSQVA